MPDSAALDTKYPRPGSPPGLNPEPNAMNRDLFRSAACADIPDSANQAGAPAYELKPQERLLQLAATVTFSRSFYAGEDQGLKDLLAVLPDLEDRFVGQAAVWARRQGGMKDSPAFLLAWLAYREDGAAFRAAFPLVVTDGKILRNLFAVLRSGVFGRRSIPIRCRKATNAWLAGRTVPQILADATGQSPSLADVIRLSHPEPATMERRALHGWIVDEDPLDLENLPAELRLWLDFHKDPAAFPLEVPDVPLRMLEGLDLTLAQRTEVAMKAGVGWARQALRGWYEAGLFDQTNPDRGRLIQHLVELLKAPQQPDSGKVKPQQVYMAYLALAELNRFPREILNALQDHLEVSTFAAPCLEGKKVHVVLDTSASMTWPVTGVRLPGQTTAVSVLQVAGLAAAILLRRNPGGSLTGFDTTARRIPFEPRDSVATIAHSLPAGGGGTNLSAGLAVVEREGPVDLVVVLSDMETWADPGRLTTATAEIWARILRSNPEARLALFNLQAEPTAQVVPKGHRVLNLGGFTDDQLVVLRDWLAGDLREAGLVEKVLAIDLPLGK